MIYFHNLLFKKPSGTSRGVLTEKPSWIIVHTDENNNKHYGEISVITSLNPEWTSDFPNIVEKKVNEFLKTFDLSPLQEFPSIKMGSEMILKSLQTKNDFEYFENDFFKSKMKIPINGLVWMGTKENMKNQILEKIENGFDCVKLKIGAIDIKEEIALLKYIRSEFGNSIELRVDANGAFTHDNVMPILNELADLKIHSIEQPIRQGQLESMREICSDTPIPIALDEELIGIYNKSEKKELLEFIQPQYIILKPSLLGGFESSDEWIDIAEANNIKWWITSALESNIGLNAIAQYTASKKNTIPQGLGTGQLYTNNFISPLEIKNGYLSYNNTKFWIIKL